MLNFVIFWLWWIALRALSIVMVQVQLGQVRTCELPNHRKWNFFLNDLTHHTSKQDYFFIFKTKKKKKSTKIHTKKVENETTAGLSRNHHDVSNKSIVDGLKKHKQTLSTSQLILFVHVHSSFFFFLLSFFAAFFFVVTIYFYFIQPNWLNVPPTSFSTNKYLINNFCSLATGTGYGCV